MACLRAHGDAPVARYALSVIRDDGVVFLAVGERLEAALRDAALAPGTLALVDVDREFRGDLGSHHSTPSSSSPMTGYACLRGPDLLRLRLDDPDTGLFRGHVHVVALLGGDHGAQLDAVVQADHAPGEADEDGERAVHQRAAVHCPDGRVSFTLLLGHGVDVLPERRGQCGCRDLDGQLVPPDQEVEQIGDDLRVGHQLHLVAEHLQVALVDAVRGYLAVVHDRPVQQCHRVRAAPPAGRVRRETGRARSRGRRCSPPA